MIQIMELNKEIEPQIKTVIVRNYMDIDPVVYDSILESKEISLFLKNDLIKWCKFCLDAISHAPTANQVILASIQSGLNQLLSKPLYKPKKRIGHEDNNMVELSHPDSKHRPFLRMKDKYLYKKSGLSG